MGDRVSQVHPEKGRDIAHKYTDYPKWRTATDIYEVQYRMPYEPCFVANKRVPRYDTGFLGYGNSDKEEQCDDSGGPAPPTGVGYCWAPFGGVAK